MPKPDAVPITLGASGAVSLAVGEFLITQAEFPALERLPPHLHERASLAIMLAGSFDLSITGKTLACEPGSAVTEPPEERHGNALGTVGARVLVVQPDPTALDAWRRVGLFDRVTFTRRSPAGGLASRIADELHAPDDMTPIAVEGLLLEMMASLGRGHRLERGAPRWLLRARDDLVARFQHAPSIRELARAASVHPDHLARAFRARFGCSVGTYVRRLRLEWAAARLRTSNDAISRIALGAGFADQSHFTRTFKRYSGVTPAEYRRLSL